MLTIHIAGVHYHVSDKVRTHVQDKFGTLNRFHKGLSSLHVTIHHDEHRNTYRVDVDMHLPTGKDVVAHDTEANLFTAIDVTADKCAVQLRKIHGKELARESARATA
jgi:ribosomal subunit interface protein